MSANRPLPEPTPETQHFWDGTAGGKLLLQQCSLGCAPYFPPRNFCPSCGSREVAIFAASGKGRLYSYIVSHRPAPGFEPPYVIAVVELEEGPRMMTNIIGSPADPHALPLDAQLSVRFERQNDRITLPLFALDVE